MKKLLVLLILMFTIPFISSCEVKPYEDCVTEWEYKMVEKQILIVSYTTYVLETEHGDITVTKKIYEKALEEGYKEICIMVNPDGENEFVGAILLDGTPLEQSLIDEIAEQVEPESEEETE